MITHYSLFINGEFVDSNDKQDVLNPDTGEVLATAAVADKRELELALDVARDAFDNGPWGKISLEERRNFILKISQGILDKAAEYCRDQKVEIKGLVCTFTM